MTQKILYLAGIVIVALPLSAFAATLTDNVTLILPSTGESYTLDSISTFDSVTVNADSFVFTMSSNQSIRIHSANRRKLANSQDVAFTCETAQSSLSYQVPTGLTATFTITPGDTCGSALGGGGVSSGSSGGGSSSTPAPAPAPVPVPARSSLSESQIQSIISLLQSFGADQTTITNVNASLRGHAVTNTTRNASAALFTRILSLGMQNEEVRQLQLLLAKNSALYPEGKVSGYFGALTQKAVTRFQKKYQIDPIGAVGPKTRAKINELIAASATP